MQKPMQISHKPCDEQTSNAAKGGLPMRANLRAGLTLNDVGDQAKDLWNNLTSAVSNTVSSVTGSAPSTPAS